MQSVRVKILSCKMVWRDDLYIFLETDGFSAANIKTISTAKTCKSNMVPCLNWNMFRFCFSVANIDFVYMCRCKDFHFHRRMIDCFVEVLWSVSILFNSVSVVSSQ